MASAGRDTNGFVCFQGHTGHKGDKGELGKDGEKVNAANTQQPFVKNPTL